MEYLNCATGLSANSWKTNMSNCEQKILFFNEVITSKVKVRQ
jgi:hypothetical protein